MTRGDAMANGNFGIAMHVVQCDPRDPRVALRDAIER